MPSVHHGHASIFWCFDYPKEVIKAGQLIALLTLQRCVPNCTGLGCFNGVLDMSHHVLYMFMVNAELLQVRPDRAMDMVRLDMVRLDMVRLDRVRLGWVGVEVVTLDRGGLCWLCVTCLPPLCPSSMAPSRPEGEKLTPPVVNGALGGALIAQNL